MTDEERILQEADEVGKRWDKEIKSALEEPEPDTSSPYGPGDPPPGCLQTIAMIVTIALMETLTPFEMGNL